MKAGMTGESVSQQSQCLIAESVSTEAERGERAVSLESGEERWEVGWFQREVRQIQHRGT